MEIIALILIFSPAICAVVSFFIMKKLSVYAIIMLVGNLLTVYITQTSRWDGFFMHSWHSILLFIPYLMLLFPIVGIFIANSHQYNQRADVKERKEKQREAAARERAEAAAEEKRKREMYGDDRICTGCEYHYLLGGCRKGTRPVFGQCVNRS